MLVRWHKSAGIPSVTLIVWLDTAGAPVGVQEKLMRHAKVSTKVNVYGKALMNSKQEANAR